MNLFYEQRSAVLITLFFLLFQGTLVNENDSASRLRGPSRAMLDAWMELLGDISAEREEEGQELTEEQGARDGQV